MKYLYRVVDRDGKNPDRYDYDRIREFHRLSDAKKWRTRLNENARYAAIAARNTYGFVGERASNFGYPHKILRVPVTAWEEVK